MRPRARRSQHGARDDAAGSRYRSGGRGDLRPRTTRPRCGPDLAVRPGDGVDASRRALHSGSMDRDGGRVRRLRAVAVGATLILMLLTPAAARADGAPTVTQRPVIAGVARDSETLTASATWTGDPRPEASWVWLRCARATGPCRAIEGATQQRYRVATADVGSVLRVRLTVTNSAGWDEERSAATSVVEPAPKPPPTPTPTPTPTPAPTETSAPLGQPASPVPAAVPTPAPLARAALLDPFP